MLSHTRTAFSLLLAASLVTPVAGQVSNPPYSVFKVPLPMIQRGVLPGVTGRVGHLAVDPKSNTLYAAASANGTLEVVELANNQQKGSIPLPEPQDVLFLSDLRRVVVSSGDGSVTVFKVDEKGVPEVKPEWTLKFAGQAESLAYDPARKTVYVVHGRNLGSFTAESGEQGASVKLEGSGLARGLALETKAGGDRAFVNLPSDGAVVVVDLSPGAIKPAGAVWKLEGKGNSALALDEEHGRLFVVSRGGTGKLTVLDLKDGRVVAAVDCPDDADDVWYDAKLGRIYVSSGGGAGQVAVFKQTLAAEASGAGGEGDGGGEAKAETYVLEHREPTNAGARTSVLVPEHRRLIVATPKVGDDPAFLYIYLIGP